MMNPTRRTLMKTIAWASAAWPLARTPLVRAAAPSSKLNIASVGCAGKGWEDLIASSGDGKLHNVVALCDIDHRKGGVQPGNLHPAQAARPLGIGAAAERFPDARRFADFRQMLDKVKDIDAVTVSTPDHMHAAVAVSAMLLGKHVYVQKPLAQTVHEVRTMHDVARRNRLVTQMGNQFRSSAGYRCLAKVMSESPVGKIREVHAWTGSPTWPQGIDRPAGEDPVPEGVHWDLWIGVDQPRPFKQHAYHNFNWRGWQAFGTGALGDMGCHVMDPVTWSLGLALPVSITAEAPQHNGETYAKWSIVRYEFPSTPLTVGPTVPLIWYDGGKRPDAKLAQAPDGYRLPSNGCLFIGEQGTVVITHSPTVPRLFPEEKFRDYSQQRIREIYKSVSSEDHYRNWTDSIIAGKPANSNFDIAAPLAEMVLLGTIAQRLPGQTLRYDAQKMRFDSNAAADALLRRNYRAGFAPPELSGS